MYGMSYWVLSYQACVVMNRFHGQTLELRGHQGSGAVEERLQPPWIGFLGDQFALISLEVDLLHLRQPPG